MKLYITAIAALTFLMGCTSDRTTTLYPSYHSDITFFLDGSSLTVQTGGLDNISRTKKIDLETIPLSAVPISGNTFSYASFTESKEEFVKETPYKLAYLPTVDEDSEALRFKLTPSQKGLLPRDTIRVLRYTYFKVDDKYKYLGFVLVRPGLPDIPFFIEKKAITHKTSGPWGT